MSAPFDPPTNFDSKSHVPQWIPPAAPTEDIDYAKLRTVDMSLLDSEDPKVVAQLVETVKGAIRDDGFLYLENFGISLEQVGHLCDSRVQTLELGLTALQLHRQFSIAQYLHRNISEEDKDRLHWDPQSGVYAGYKPPHGWRVSPRLKGWRPRLTSG
jgi:hypothetical protein